MDNVDVRPINDMIIDTPPEYVYLKVPVLYLCTYHKLLHYMVDFGIDLVKDCAASCSAKNKKILDCWGMFQAACAAYTLEDFDKANFLIKYIDEQLKLIYDSNGEVVYNGDGIYPINEDGHFKALVTCSTPIEAHTHFNPDDVNCRINHQDGHLYVKYMNEKHDKGLRIVLQEDGEHIVGNPFAGHLVEDISE